MQLHSLVIFDIIIVIIIIIIGLCLEITFMENSITLYFVIYIYICTVYITSLIVFIHSAEYRQVQWL